MAVQFICRLLVLRSPDNKFRVKYDWLGSDFFRLLTVTGPRVVIPPEGTMTGEEYQRWEFELVNNTGSSLSFSLDNSVDAPLVGVQRTIEDLIPSGKVATELIWYDDGAGGKTLAVAVKNDWNEEIPKFALSTL